MKNSIKIIDCGIQAYNTTLKLQQKLLAEQLEKKSSDTILLVEHKPVITLGARTAANRLIKSTRQIEDAGIEIVQIRRGGGTTAHNPGQLVVYPIINLKNYQLGASDFVHLLEKTGRELLSALAVKAETKKGLPGLWVEERKIASIGVQLKRWITFHGIAININNDLGIFDFIVPCGLDNVKMTSAEKELHKTIDITETKEILKKILHEKFDNGNK